MFFNFGTEKRINFAKDNVIVANVEKIDSNNEKNEKNEQVQAIWTGSEFVQEVSSEAGAVGVILDRTPIYAESGGQTFDIADIKGERARKCGGKQNEVGKRGA